MPCCAAFGCKTRDFNKAVNPPITFHRFPSDPDVKKTWVQAIGRGEWQPSKNSTICSKHFKEEDFDRSPFCSKLKNGVVPSIFDCFADGLREEMEERRITSKRKLLPTKEQRSPIKKELKQILQMELDYASSELSLNSLDPQASRFEVKQKIVIKEEILSDEDGPDSECYAEPVQIFIKQEDICNMENESDLTCPPNDDSCLDSVDDIDELDSYRDSGEGFKPPIDNSTEDITLQMMVRTRGGRRVVHFSVVDDEQRPSTSAGEPRPSTSAGEPRPTSCEEPRSYSESRAKSQSLHAIVWTEAELHQMLFEDSNPEIEFSENKDSLKRLSSGGCNQQTDIHIPKQKDIQKGKHPQRCCVICSENKRHRDTSHYCASCS